MNKPTAGFVCELIGTFALMFVGGATFIHYSSSGNLIAVALAVGLILSVMVTATMHISGGQFNPAVSIALAIIRRQTWGQAAAWVIAQVFGAAIAAKLVSVMFVTAAVEASKLADPSASAANTSDPTVLFALGTIATFFLMFSIMGTAVDQRGVGGNRAVGGFAIGLCVAACILCFGPYTGASVNPARAFGAALLGDFSNIHWVSWASPILGASIAALLWDKVLIGRKSAA